MDRIIYFAASTNSFYFSDIGSDIPQDAKPVSVAVFNNMIAEKSAGNVISSDANGDPIALPPVQIVQTIEQIRAAMQCTNSQFRRALTQKGWRADVEAAVSAAGQDIRDMYEYDTVFYRGRAEFSQIAAVINKTEADIDSVFELAITLP